MKYWDTRKAVIESKKILVLVSSLSMPLFLFMSPHLQGVTQGYKEDCELQTPYEEI